VKRRDLLGLAALSMLPGCKLSLEQGLLGECREGNGLGDLPIVKAAWRGLDPDRVWDVHAHLFGNGRSASGIWIDPDFDDPKSIPARVRHTFFSNAGCVGEDPDRWDQAMVARIVRLVDDMPTGAKVMLLAFDFTYDDTGTQRKDLTTFSVPNKYAHRIARSRPDRFEWICSIHPNRPDAMSELEWSKANGARAVKWLPSTMGIDLRAPASVAFYNALARLDMPLLVHVGEEQAVAGARRNELVNPTFLRTPLERGVRVIAAHCATLGQSDGLDNFTLFARLMDDPAYRGRLFGDISAVTQANRMQHLPQLLALSRRWEGRLLNGSDYPLPGILPLFSIDAMVKAGLLDPAVVAPLRQLRHVNALLFDFVLKRHLGFADAVFETRGFFHV
jgi:predicted TIM-barrel fold metal-dependent hydrolase